LLTSL
jgi:Na+/melibiose symporter-like transporter